VTKKLLGHPKVTSIDLSDELLDAPVKSKSYSRFFPARVGRFGPALIRSYGFDVNADFDRDDPSFAWDDRDEAACGAKPTPGEQLFDCLGQLYRRWHTGQSETPPSDVDVQRFARLLDVWRALEFAQDDGGVVFLHFPNEVLVIDARQEFPWRLLSAWEWAAEREFGPNDPCD